MLALRVGKRLGAFELAVELTVLVGESGAGKSTILRLIAGLEQPDTGRIALDDRVYADPAAGVAVPAWRRGVGFVFQDYALFPHLSVSENVVFGLRASGVSRAESRRRQNQAWYSSRTCRAIRARQRGSDGSGP